MGPLNNRPQLKRVSDLTSDAKRRGATVHAGGERLGRKGYFFAPTLVSGVDDSAPIVAEEQFGPVLPILPYKNLDDALARANATHFGLGASVWSRDVDRAAEVAESIDAGTVWVNQHVALTAKAPFGGAKWSGIGLAVRALGARIVPAEARDQRQPRLTVRLTGERHAQGSGDRSRAARVRQVE